MPPNSIFPKSQVGRDREFWIVAVLFWGVIAPIFLYGFARAFRMPAELLTVWLNLSTQVSDILDMGFQMFGLGIAVYGVLDIWKRLRVSLANRSA